MIDKSKNTTGTTTPKNNHGIITQPTEHFPNNHSRNEHANQKADNVNDNTG